MELEGIFTEPPSDSDSPNQHQSLYSIAQSSEYMPSSPPPWPIPKGGSNPVIKDLALKSSRVPLDVLEEEEEDHPQVPRESNLSAVTEPPVIGQSNSNAECHGSQDQGINPELGDDHSMRCSTTGDLSMVDAEEALAGLRALLISKPKPSRHSEHSSISQSVKNSSSVTDSFSPVFISKHNTVDGRIAYAAVDPSDPQALSRLRQRASSNRSLKSHAAIEDGEQDECINNHLASGQPMKTQDLQPISNYVTCQRGGQSDDDSSFKRKPLSPSASSSHLPSDSLVPSDSVSQTYLKARKASLANQVVQVQGSEAVRIQASHAIKSGDGADDFCHGSHNHGSGEQNDVNTASISSATLREHYGSSHGGALQIMEKGVPQFTPPRDFNEANEKADTEGSCRSAGTIKYPCNAPLQDHDGKGQTVSSAEGNSTANQSRESSCQSNVTAIQKPATPQEQSVSSQDYVDEAIKIIDLIRARRNMASRMPMDELESDVHQGNASVNEEVVMPPHSLSLVNDEHHEISFTKGGSDGRASAGSDEKSLEQPLDLGVGRTLSLSRVDERHEISFSQTVPDGRTMSLSLSVSTPLPRIRPARNNLLMSSGQRTNSLLPQLSPLSQFTINQDDARHFHNQKLDSAADVRLLTNERGLYVDSALATRDLVTKLTDAEPNEPFWDTMRSLSLKGKQIESTHMLDELCPSIEQLDVADNKLKHVIGIPKTVRELDVSNNGLSGFTEWNHLPNVQYLDVSRNELDSLDAFHSLTHIREFRADSNNVSSLEGVLELDRLLSLSLRNNKLASANLGHAHFSRLTHLDLSFNGLRRVTGLEFLPSLEQLDLTGNNLKAFPSTEAVSKNQNLIRLNVDQNALSFLDISAYPNLRELYADANSLTTVSGIEGHAKLHTLYLRDQRSTSDQTLQLYNLNDFVNLTHLYLSGTSLDPALVPSFAAEVPFYNLQTLDVAFTGLQSLPLKMGMLMPNLRTLNLNANSLKDLRPLKGIVGLRRLFAAGNRLSRLRRIAKVLGSLGGLCGGALEEVDFRDGPLCCGFYPTAKDDGERRENRLVHCGDGKMKDASATDELENGETGELRHLLPQSDAERDAVYKKRLDEDTKLRRRLYELLLATKCKKLKRVDGLDFDREGVNRRDTLWRRLVELGVVKPTEA